MNIEIMRNTLYKAYLEDFYRFCQVKGLRHFVIHYIDVLSCYVFFFSDFPQIYVIPKQKLGGATAEIMSDLLAFEADRRAVNITINRYMKSKMIFNCILVNMDTYITGIHGFYFVQHWY